MVSQLDALKQLYGSGPMTAKQVQFLRDVQAFIDFCIDNGLSFELTVATLGHDMNGIIAHEDAFLPKVTGYAERVRRLSAAAAEMAEDAAASRNPTGGAE